MKKLSLRREVIRTLARPLLTGVAGAMPGPPTGPGSTVITQPLCGCPRDTVWECATQVMNTCRETLFAPCL
jgi:hypothetical protein